MHPGLRSQNLCTRGPSGIELEPETGGGFGVNGPRAAAWVAPHARRTRG